MALYHKWDVKNDFSYVLQFFSLISDGLSGVIQVYASKEVGGVFQIMMFADKVGVWG